MKTITIRAVSGKSLVDRLIQWRTDCKINHVEFLSGNGKFCIGSQPAGGVEARPRDYLGPNVTEYLFTLKLTENQAYRLTSYQDARLCEGYNYEAIFQNAFNSSCRLFSSRHRADCSEFVSDALAFAGVPLFGADSRRLVRTVTPRDVILCPLLDHK